MQGNSCNLLKNRKFEENNRLKSIIQQKIQQGFALNLRQDLKMQTNGQQLFGRIHQRIKLQHFVATYTLYIKFSAKDINNNGDTNKTRYNNNKFMQPSR